MLAGTTTTTLFVPSCTLQWFTRYKKIDKYIERVQARGGALGYFLGGYVPPGTSNWHPVVKKISPKIDTPFLKWANFLYPVLEFALKLIPRSRNGPIFYTPF